MQDLVEYLARSLVDKPEEVSVECYDEDDGSVVFELSVAEDDVGKIIGRGGRTVNALRCVLRACAAKQGGRLLLDVVD
ncbi:MAG TPA: KH domain-containing protein [Thermoleophilaceae bacterium]